MSNTGTHAIVRFNHLSESYVEAEKYFEGTAQQCESYCKRTDKSVGSEWDDFALVPNFEGDSVNANYVQPYYWKD